MRGEVPRFFWLPSLKLYSGADRRLPKYLLKSIFIQLLNSLPPAPQDHLHLGCYIPVPHLHTHSDFVTRKLKEMDTAEGVFLFPFPHPWLVVNNIHFQRHNRGNPRAVKWTASAAADVLGMVISSAVLGAHADKCYDSFPSAWLRQVAYWQGA